MKIKVCGMRDPDNLRQLIDLKPDYIGFIFHEGSKRFVGNIDKNILAPVPQHIKTTGVFVDAERYEIEIKIQKYALRAVQLHGKETAAFCKQIKEGGVEVIKAFGVNESFDFDTLNEYVDSVHYFLFDTKSSQHGGSGQVFDWNILKNYNLTLPYFLSGGLSIDNLNEVSAINDNRLYAVDINSRFETEPGMKDLEKVKKAIELIKT
jgi:phosphoribosylanthranilate isomerase